MSDLSFAAPQSDADFEGLRPQYDSTVDQVERAEHDLVETMRDLIATVSTAGRETWPFVIKAARRGGVTDDDIRRELGTSPSTVHRWINDGVAPREGTRRLMKGALIALLDQRLAGRPEPRPAAQPSERRKKAQA